jgi:hypothetical protein
MGGYGAAPKLLNHQAMAFPIAKSKKILIPDVPPPLTRKSELGLVIAGIGILCGSVMIAAMLFVVLGA